MRKQLKLFIQPTLLSVSLLASISSYGAPLIPDLSELLKTNSTHANVDFEIIQEQELFFNENPEVLSNLHVQMCVAVLDPYDYENRYTAYEIDGLSKILRDTDKVLLTKSAAVFKHIKPEFFKASVLTSHEYMSKAFHDSVNELIDPKQFIVRQKRNFRFKDVHSTVYFSSYNFHTDESQMMDKETAEKLLSSFPSEDRPVVITSMRAGPNDISYGSHGWRMVDFYYAVNENDTLMISYNLLTLKREPMMGLAWSLIQSEASRKLLNGYKISVSNVRQHLIQKHNETLKKDEL